jgi:hypothetical protein
MAGAAPRQNPAMPATSCLGDLKILKRSLPKLKSVAIPAEKQDDEIYFVKVAQTKRYSGEENANCPVVPPPKQEKKESCKPANKRGHNSAPFPDRKK